MKKLVSLVMVLALVLCLATVAFADETTAPTGASADDPIVVSTIADLASVDVEMGAIKWFKLPQEWSGKVLNVSAMMSMPAIYIWNSMWEYAQPVAQGMMAASYYLDGNTDMVIGIGSAWGYAMTGACSLEEPVEGSAYKPTVITDLSAPISVTCMETAEGLMYYMSYTAGEAGGEFTISNVQGNFYQISMEADNSWGGYWDDSTEASVSLFAGETATIVIMGNDLDPITFDAAFTAFAEGESEYYPIEIADQDKDYTFDVNVTPGAPVYVSLSDVNGAILTINDPNAYIDGANAGVYELDDDDDNVLTVQVEVYGDSAAIIAIGTYGDADVKYTVTVSEPEGYDENPEVITNITEINAEVPGGVSDKYYYQWTPNASGKVTLTVTGAEWTDEYKFWAVKEYAQIWDEDYQEYVDDYDNPISWYDVPVKMTVYINGTEVVAGSDAIVFDVNKDDVVILVIQTMPIYEYETYGYGAYVDVAGSVEPLGSANNPIVINNAHELSGIDVSANGVTYIAINSQLNGQILTIVGNANTTVTLNGTALQSTNGVFVAELTGVPTNALIVSNSGNQDASCVASITWPEGSVSNPVVIIAVGEHTASVAAGEEVYYAVNAKMSGAVLTVKGASYVIIDGTKYEAKDGVVTATLKSTGATISVTVGNSGTADISAKLAVTILENPKTGDAGILMSVVTALVSVMGATALVIKKKED